MGPLLVRADAGPEIGLGHVLRTLALAQTWLRRGGEVTYATAQPPLSLRERLEREGATVVELPARHPDPRDAMSLAPLLARQWEWTVVDGYHLDAPYRDRIRAAGRRVLAIGDLFGQELGAADAILNQNAGVEADPPRAAPGTLVLLGGRYALVREEFLAVRPRPRDGEARRVLVTFGGGDDEGATRRALAALALLPEGRIEARVLLGSSNSRRPELEAEIASAPFPCECVVAGAGIAELFAWADVAVTASGSTCWELCVLGVPMAAVQLAENQAVVQRGLAEAGAALALGSLEGVSVARLADAVCSLLDDAELRLGLSQAASALVDGRGAERVVDALLGHAA